MSTIEASLQLEIAQYQAALRKAQSQIDGFKTKAQKDGAGLGDALFGGIAKRAAMIAPILGTGFGAKGILDAVVNMERLEKMMQTTAGSASAARARMAELREVARLPGIDFEQAIQGDVRLRAVGLSADLSKAAITEFGNALALVGGSSSDLDGVFLALSQIAAKGNVFAEEINQIAERVPQVRAVMKDVFGTADTEAIQAMGLSADEFISRLTAGFGELSRASSGLQDEFSEISTLGMEMANDVGSPLVKSLVPAFTELVTLIAANKDAIVTFGQGAGEAVRIAISGINVLQDAFNALGQAMNSDDSFTEVMARNRRLREEAASQKRGGGSATASGAAAGGAESPPAAGSTADAGAAGGGAGASPTIQPPVAKTEDPEKAAERIKKLQQDIVEMDMQRMTPAERLAKLTEDQAAKIEEMRNQGGLFFDATVEGMRKFAEAQTSKGSAGAEQTLERLKEILKIQQELEALQQTVKQEEVSAAEAEAKSKADQQKEASAQRRKQLEEEISAEKERQAQSGALDDFTRELEIIEARARGENDLAEAMQRQLDVAQMKSRLMEQMNLSEEEALALAERHVDAERELNSEKQAAPQESRGNGRYDAEGRRADGRRQIKGYSQEQGGIADARARAQKRIDEARASRVIPSGMDEAFGRVASPLAETAATNASREDRQPGDATRALEDQLARLVAISEQGLLGDG